VNLWAWLQRLWHGKRLPEHLRRGSLGEQTASRDLTSLGYRLLAANYRSKRVEIDLVMRDGRTLVFVEVKTRRSGGWLRPAAAVNAGKRRRLTQAGLDYLREIRHPAVPVRFDIVEVLLDGAGAVAEVRHLRHAFVMEAPHRYG